MAVIREITFGDGSVVRITDWGDYPLWSRLVISTNELQQELSQAYYLFNYNVGMQMPATNQRATYADSNMPGAGQLPMGHQMLVYSLQVIPDEFAAAGANGRYYPLLLTPEASFAAAMYKWRKIMFQSHLALRVEQTKSFVEGRLDHFPMGGGFLMEGAGGADGEAGAYEIFNGDRTWLATRRLAMPVHLGSLEMFNVSIDWPRGGVDYDQSSCEFEQGFGLTVRFTGPRQRPTA